MIAVVDYGVGNVRSVLCALRRISRQAALTSEPRDILAADGVILPGVGAFGAAMDNLRSSRLDAVLLDVVKARRPLLGICLGHQLLFSESEEHGRHEGLGLIPGVVRRFPAGITVPHMGWNEMKQRRASPLFGGIADGAFFYFAHSYYAMPEDEAVTIGATDYEGDFASAVASGAVFGTQFHPEKSGPIGLALLENFCRLSERG